MPIKTSALVLTVVILGLASSTASAKQYVLKHPKHEHCHTRYTRKVEHVKVHGHKVTETVCVYHAPSQPSVAPPAAQPTLLPTPPPASTPDPAPTPAFPAPAPAPVKQLNLPYATEVESYLGSTTAYGDLILSFAASVFALEEPNAGSGTVKTELSPVSVQYKVTDTTTGVVESDSAIPAPYGIAACSIVESFDYPDTTYEGDGAVGCGFSNFTLPDSDNIGVVASYAGSASYLPSTGYAWKL
jgi:hypothetical protein